MGSDSASKETQIINELKRILYPWEKLLLIEIIQAYFASIPTQFRQEWLSEKPNSIENILNIIQDLPQGETYINNFINNLLKVPKVSEKIGSELKNIDKKVNISSEASSLKHEETELATDQYIPNYLMISLKERLQEKGSYYVNAWFIYHDYKKNKIFISLDSFNQKSITIDEFDKNLPILLAELMEEINSIKNLNGNYSQPMIVLFLPLKLLNEPIDCYEYECMPIGCSFQLVLRYEKRFEKITKAFRNKNIWDEKWKKLHSQNCIDKAIVAGNCQNLLTELRKTNSLCLHSIQPLSEKNINYLNSSATPVAIWLRKIPGKINYEYEFNQFIEDVKHQIHDLPKLIQEKRTDAIDIDKDMHIGHHLSIIWEDPELLPPDKPHKHPT